MKSRKKKEKNRRRKVVGRTTCKGNGRVHQYHKLEHASTEHPFSEWDELVEKAKKDEIDEAERAMVAMEDSILACLNTFTKSLTGINLDKYNTNLGLVLGEEKAIAGSMVLFNTGPNGTHEFVPVVIKVSVGQIQSVQEHVEFLTSGEWKAMAAPKPPTEDISIYKDNPGDRPMVMRAPRSAGIR